MTQAQEKQVQKLMFYLNIPREEAIAEMLEDEKVDKMTSIKEINADLTTEQQKVSKDMRKTTSVDAYGKKRTREKKNDDDKGALIQILSKALMEAEVSVEVVNEERELAIVYNDRRFKIVLSAPRS